MPDDVQMPAQPPARSMSIKGLTPALPEKGRIKIGMKGQMRKSKNGTEFQPPVKLDHFLITTMERGPDGNFIKDEEIHKLLGDKPTSIPVRLIYNDATLNFPTRYACFNGRKLWCSGDGNTAMRLDNDGKYGPVECRCGRERPEYEGREKCKMNGALSAVLDLKGVGGIGGVWKLRTTSYNSIVGLMSSMALIWQATGGILANLPLKLNLRPKQATAPDGAQQTIYVVSIEFDGDMDELLDRAHQVALNQAKTMVSIQHIEEEARRALTFVSRDVPLPGDDTDEIVEEFYPEQVDQDGVITGGAPPRPQRADYDGEQPEAEGEVIDQEPPAEKEPEPKSPLDEADFELIDDVGEPVDTYTGRIFSEQMLERIQNCVTLRELDTLMENNEPQIERLKPLTDAYTYIREDADSKRKRLTRSSTVTTPTEAATPPAKAATPTKPVGPEPEPEAKPEPPKPAAAAKPATPAKPAQQNLDWIPKFKERLNAATRVNAIDTMLAATFKQLLDDLRKVDRAAYEDLLVLANEAKQRLNAKGA